MEEKTLFNKLKNKSLFEKAFVYAIYDRINNDDFCNFFEINYYRSRKPELLYQEITDILHDFADFKHSVCFASYRPKDNLCFRRCVYIPFKELVLRYMILIIIVELTEYTLSKQCFSYRIASHKESSKNLFEPYHKLWNSFAKWQEETVQNQSFKILVKTDISSFYDTVSHDYLINFIMKQLDIKQNCNFIKLLRKILNFRVISYSFVDNSLFESDFLQGLVIGNNIDGYLANIYLKDMDEALEKVNVVFGRYVDDIKIFANTEQEASRYTQIIQEYLLKKGLNLNVAKTKKYLGEVEIKEYIYKSKIPDDSISNYFNDDEPSIEKNQNEKNQTIPIDNSTSSETDFVDKYHPDNSIESSEEAKLWTNYLNEKLKPHQNLDIELVNRQIYKLPNIIKKYPKEFRLCAWLIVKFCFWGYPNAIQKVAYKTMLIIFNDEEINSWIKARILHHLIKPRRGKLSYIKRLNTSPTRIEEFKPILKQLIAYPSVELQINSLYAFYEIIESKQDIIKVISNIMPKPIPLPIKDIVSQLQILDFSDISVPTFEELIPDLKESNYNDF